jgi:DegV family protein with EDD domain
MKRQYEVQHDRKASIALVTDSTCDLPVAILDEYQIHVVPVNIHFGDSHFLDRMALTPSQFYEMLDEADEYPTTSQPAMKAFYDMYVHLAKYYDAIISIHLAEALSGTVNAARLAAGKVDHCQIHVIDSRVLSSALGLMVIRIAEEIAKGTAYEDVVQLAESLPAKAGVLVSVKTLEYMVRGGRVSPLKGMLAKALNLKPIISLDERGATTITGKAFSEKGCVKKIMKMIGHLHWKHPIRMFAIGHAHTESEAQKLRQKVENVLGQKVRLIVDIAPVIGVHAGIGALSVAYLTE